MRDGGPRGGGGTRGEGGGGDVGGTKKEGGDGGLVHLDNAAFSLKTKISLDERN